MYHFFQFLRGTVAEWKANDVPLKDGEIGFLKMASGRVQLRVGNGKKKFSALKPVAERYIVKDDLGFGTFETAMEIRLETTDLETVEYYFPTTPDDDFYAFLVFETEAQAPSFVTDDDCKFTGDDTSGGIFTPTANKHYNLLFFYDGTKQAVVRAVAK